MPQVEAACHQFVGAVGGARSPSGRMIIRLLPSSGRRPGSQVGALIGRHRLRREGNGGKQSRRDLLEQHPSRSRQVMDRVDTEEVTGSNPVSPTSSEAIFH